MHRHAQRTAILAGKIVLREERSDLRRVMGQPVAMDMGRLRNASTTDQQYAEEHGNPQPQGPGVDVASALARARHSYISMTRYRDKRTQRPPNLLQSHSR